MGFKRNDNIGSVLEQNHKINNGDAVVLQKKVREKTKPYNFTLKPSVREKLDKLVEYDYDSEALSAASYLSDMIEQRYNDLNIEKHLK
jgi:hypothetical protein